MIANSRVWHSPGQPAYVREGLDRSNMCIQVFQSLSTKLPHQLLVGGNFVYCAFCFPCVLLW